MTTADFRPSSVNLATAALSAGPEIHQAYHQALTMLPQHLSHTGYDQHGLPVLREAIARRYCERGLPTRSEEVMIVNGALSAFSLVLRLLTGPGDRVVIDAPSFRAPPVGRSASPCRSTAGTATDWRQPLRKPHRGWPG